MAKRQRRKYAWFPTVGTDGIVDNDNISGRVFGLAALASGAQDVVIAPLIPDVPLEGDDIDVNAGGQLAQALGQEYLLERIVGKVFIGVVGDRNANQNPTTWSAVLVGVGIFVARANDTDVGGGQNTPIGSATTMERVENYSPLSEELIREPWLWRRTWVLGNPANDYRDANNIAANEIPYTVFPPSTAHYGSVMDGPHIDARSNRRIGNDERLWLAISTVGLIRQDNGSYPATAGEALGLLGYIDYRVLGRLVRAHGKSSF